jgi:hypothetical protein
MQRFKRDWCSNFEYRCGFSSRLCRREWKKSLNKPTRKPAIFVDQAAVLRLTTLPSL